MTVTDPNDCVLKNQPTNMLDNSFILDKIDSSTAAQQSVLPKSFNEDISDLQLQNANLLSQLNEETQALKNYQELDLKLNAALENIEKVSELNDCKKRARASQFRAQQAHTSGISLADARSQERNKRANERAQEIKMLQQEIARLSQERAAILLAQKHPVQDSVKKD